MPLPPGGPTAAAFAAAVDELTAYVASTAADAAARVAGGCGRAPAPAPGWAWTADRVLRLLQQHADGLPLHVLKTALWGDWKQLPPEGVPTPELRWTPLASALAAAGAPDARGVAAVAVQASVSGVDGDVVSLTDASVGRAVDARLPAALAAALAAHAPPPTTLRLARVRGWRPAAGGRPSLIVGGAAAVAPVARWRDLPPSLALPATASAAAAGGAPDGAPVAGVVVAVGGLEAPGSAAAAAAATGVARVAWLADRGAAAAPAAPPTPLLLLDGDAALGDLLVPGEGVVLPGAVAVPAGGGGAPAALAPARGALVFAVVDADADDAPENTAPLPCTNAGTQPTRPLLAGLAPGRAARVAAVGVVVAVGADAAGGVAVTFDDGSATACLRLPPGAVPRSALAVRAGDAVAVTCARVRVSRGGSDGRAAFSQRAGPSAPSLPPPSLLLDPAGAPVAVQSLARLPGLLSSAPLAARAAAPLAAAAAAGGVAVVRVACGAVVGVHRVHVDCGRVMAPADLGEEEGEGGGRAPSPSSAAPAVLVVDGGHAGCSGDGVPPPPAVDDGPLWTCAACGVDCSRARSALALSARLCLVEDASNSPSTVVPAIAFGDAAEAVLGCGALDFAALAPGERAAAAGGARGRVARVCLVARAGGPAEVALAALAADVGD